MKYEKIHWQRHCPRVTNTVAGVNHLVLLGKTSGGAAVITSAVTVAAAIGRGRGNGSDC